MMSCSTGGGHNSAGQAVADELERRGHTVTFLDPYQLAGKNAAATIGNLYIKLVRKSPKLFGFVYALGEVYRRFPIHSPVYWINGKMAASMQRFLEEHPFDVIVMSHMYPAHILSNLKENHISIPKTVLIATDYTCIPFMEETACDYYVVPSEDLSDEFCFRGIPKERILPFGIPVRKEFIEKSSKTEAKARLHLDTGKQYILLSGGSIGAGKMEKTAKIMHQYLQKNPNSILIVICGNNQKLYQRLQSKYGHNPQFNILQSTNHMADYMKACDIFITKPGGLSSTEAAVSGIPLIHISPIPGCELRNVHFFEKHGMSIYVQHPNRKLQTVLNQLQNASTANQMKESQNRYVDSQATSKLCDFIVWGNERKGKIL